VSAPLIRVYECWGGPRDGEPLELPDDHACYLIPQQGTYWRGVGKLQGKLVWKERRG